MRATVGLTLLLVTTAASAQNAAVPSTWFQVIWEERPMGGAPTIGGWVQNDTSYRVCDVRLRVEGVDAAGQAVGDELAWTIGDIAAGSRGYFVVAAIPGATTYRITVASFDVVSHGD